MSKESLLPHARGTNLEEVSTGLDWREFERLAEFVFKNFGFTTFRNYRLRRPRAEIDLVAAKSGIAFVIDCKHWKRTVGRASMIGISERQIKRAQRIVGLENIQLAIPMILTLHDESLHVLENGTPIVPIHKVSDFILNWEVAPEIKVISKQSG